MWFKVEGGITAAELGTLRTIGENSWGQDGATNMCASVRENFFSIWTTYCRDDIGYSAAEPKLVHTDGNPTHSNQILSMMPTIHNLSRVLVAFGTSWNEPLTLWDGNHRAISFYADFATRMLHENGLKWQVKSSGHEGCSLTNINGRELWKEERFTLFVGLSKNLTAMKCGFICHLSNLHEKQ